MPGKDSGVREDGSKEKQVTVTLSGQNHPSH